MKKKEREEYIGIRDTKLSAPGLRISENFTNREKEGREEEEGRNKERKRERERICFVLRVRGKGALIKESYGIITRKGR